MKPAGLIVVGSYHEEALISRWLISVAALSSCQARRSLPEQRVRPRREPAEPVAEDRTPSADALGDEWRQGAGRLGGARP